MLRSVVHFHKQKNPAPSPFLSLVLDKMRIRFTDSAPHIREFHNGQPGTD